MASAETALVLTDPQNDFLSEDGVAWEPRRPRWRRRRQRSAWLPPCDDRCD